MPDPHSILPQRRELSTGCPRKTAHYRSWWRRRCWSLQ
jgi:hypothetical protein